MSTFCMVNVLQDPEPGVTIQSLKGDPTSQTLVLGSHIHRLNVDCFEVLAPGVTCQNSPC